MAQDARHLTTAPPDVVPMVHVMSILSGSADVLKHPVLNLVGNAMQSLEITSAPYLPDVKPEHLPQHFKATSPDFLILTSEYGHLSSDEKMEQHIETFQELFKSVKENQATKLIFLVTGDAGCKEEEMCSKKVEEKVKTLTKNILKLNRLTIMSWNKRPSHLHQDVFKSLLRSHKATARQLEKMPEDVVIPETTPEKGHLRYRAIILKGREYAVLKYDPYEWRPDDKILKAIMAANEGKLVELEFWASKKGNSTIAILSQSKTLDKLNTGYSADFNPMKGFLKFRAELVHGRITEVLRCVPVLWRPDERDVDFLHERFQNEPKVMLEYWSDSVDGPNNPPVILSTRTSGFKLPSFFDVLKQKK